MSPYEIPKDNYSAAIFVVDEIVSGVLGNLSDLSIQPISGRNSVVYWVVISGYHNTFESELNVEEIQRLLNLVDHRVCVQDFFRNRNSSGDEHVQDSGSSCGVDAIVDSLWFASKFKAKQAKNKWVSWLVKEVTPDCTVSVVQVLGEEVVAFKVRKLSNEGLSKAEQVFETLISPNQLVAVDDVCSVVTLIFGKSHETGQRAGTKTNWF
jgi:hypothetical protein